MTGYKLISSNLNEVIYRSINRGDTQKRNAKSEHTLLLNTMERDSKKHISLFANLLKLLHKEYLWSHLGLLVTGI
jgi:hypothetical protein